MLYVHENQLAYPTLFMTEERLFQFGWAQLTSMLSATVVAWNSLFNLDSFIAALPKLLNAIPDKAQRPKVLDLVHTLYAKSVVLHCVVAPPRGILPLVARGEGALRVCWPHRWEHDKGPEVFFEAMLREGVTCEVVVLGESFSETPAIFSTAKAALETSGRLAHWGFAASKEAYFSLLASCDVVISTAAHEFFGVSTVEGVLSGCYPLCPNDLAYPEVLNPCDRERGAYEAAQGRLLECLGGGGGGAAAAAVPSSPIWSPPSSIKLGGQGCGDGKRYRPTPRACPYLYASEEGASHLAKALIHLSQSREKLAAWRDDLKAALAGNPVAGTWAESGDCFPNPLYLAQSVLRFTPERQKGVWTPLFPHLEAQGSTAKENSSV